MTRVVEQPRSALTPPPISKKPVVSALATPGSSPRRTDSSPARRGRTPEASSAEVKAEKMTTKPQTFSMFFTDAVTARARAPGSTSGAGGTRAGSARYLPRIAAPAVTAARAWQRYSTAPALTLPNTPTPAAPIRNAGPELLQKPSSRAHSRRVITPRSASEAAVAAPSG